MWCDYQPWDMPPSIGAALCQTGASTYQCCPSNQQCKKPLGSTYSVCCPSGEQGQCGRQLASVLHNVDGGQHNQISKPSMCCVALCHSAGQVCGNTCCPVGAACYNDDGVAATPTKCCPSGSKLTLQSPQRLGRLGWIVFSHRRALATHHEPLLLHLLRRLGLSRNRPNKERREAGLLPGGPNRLH